MYDNTSKQGVEPSIKRYSGSILSGGGGVGGTGEWVAMVLAGVRCGAPRRITRLIFNPINKAIQ